MKKNGWIDIGQWREKKRKNFTETKMSCCCCFYVYTQTDWTLIK